MNAKKLILLSAPSGSGKTTIIKFLLKKIDVLRFSISATTRPKRPNEVHGRDYYFLDQATFKRDIEAGKFLEWESVYEGVYYGTYSSEIERIHALSAVPILDLDVVGGINTKKIYGERCCSIFIYVPNNEDLKKRLLERGMAEDETLHQRLSKATFEKQQMNCFDFCVQNVEVEKACEDTQKIVEQFIATR